MSPTLHIARRIVGTLTVALIALLMAQPAVLCQAQENPDITGHWVLNRDRSIMGSGRVPISLTIDKTIEFEEGKYTFKVVNETSRGGRERYEEVFAADGQPHVVELETGNLTVTAEWKYNSLMVTRTRAAPAGMPAGRGGRGGAGGGGGRGATPRPTR